MNKRIEGYEKAVQEIGREMGTYNDHMEHTIHIKYEVIYEKYNKEIKYNKWHHWHDWLKMGLESNV